MQQLEHAAGELAEAEEAAQEQAEEQFSRMVMTWDVRQLLDDAMWA